jgi:hypothetical protein
MASNDRRLFIKFGAQYFLFLRDTPELTSDEVHAFMNAQLGIDVPLHVPNAVAFDMWRATMELRGYKNAFVKDRDDEIRAKAAKLIERSKFLEEHKLIPMGDGTYKTLAELRMEAPNVPAGELLRAHEARLRAELKKL